MKRFKILTLAGLACSCLFMNAAMADSMSINSFRHKVLPVLVHVNAQGKVTEVSPAQQLRPRFQRLLRANLDQMITMPATHHGRPMASQFVINLGLKAAPRDDGRYDVSFKYVSSQPVPSGSWLWLEEDGHRLALVSRDANQRWLRRGQYRNALRHQYYQYRRSYNQQHRSHASKSRNTSSGAQRAAGARNQKQ